MATEAAINSTFELFTSKDYLLTGNLLEVPGLGGVTDGILQKEGITSTHQLIGVFMAGNKDPVQFKTFLEKTGTPAGHRGTVVDAITKRVFEVGIKVLVQLPEVDYKGEPISSKLTNMKAETIRATKFNNCLPHDLPGVGCGNETDKKKNDSVLALEKNMGITTTWQLYGAMFRHFDQVPTSENLLAFRQELKDKGVAAQYVSTIIDAMIQKLEVGLENYARKQKLDTHHEPSSPEKTTTAASSSSPPGTGQKSRTASRVSEPPPPERRTVRAPPPPQSSILQHLVPALGVIAVAILGYHFFVGGELA